ncbi:hypothetical protein ACFQAT_09770 [Undibacterium arcticum]|uniref:hypothetical protein n=1 Tax=Undibacterium arcticum TaxID=1762892 RepID=UPI003623E255
MRLPPEGENSQQELPSAPAGLNEILHALNNTTIPETGTGTPFPVRWLAIGLVLTTVVLLTMLWSTFDLFRNVTTVQLRNLRLQELSGRVVHLDEVLTMSARMAATTGDLQWERRYRQFESQLDAVIKETLQLTILSESAEATKQTDAANLKLVDMENQAFALVRAGQPGQAKLILFSEAYEAQKKIYAEGIVRLVQHIQEDLAASQRDKRNQALFFVTAAMFSIVFMRHVAIGLEQAAPVARRPSDQLRRARKGGRGASDCQRRFGETRKGTHRATGASAQAVTRGFAQGGHGGGGHRGAA